MSEQNQVARSNETRGTSQVELSPMGFIVTDAFGPEGRRPVVALVGGDLRPYVFPARHEAAEYARLRNTHAAIYSAEGYSEAENEAREAAKRYAIDHAQTFATFTV